MTKRCRWLYLIAIAGLILAILSHTAQADDASLGAVGYGVVPLDNDQVTMAAERVEAQIRGDEAWVTCVFTFTNTGSATDVLMGFPQAESITGGESELVDFRALVDEEEVPVTFRQNGEPQGGSEYPIGGWHTFTVPFAVGQSRIVQNTYHGRLTWQSNGGRAFEYVLHTGATWQGAIGQADVVVRWQKDRYVAPETLSADPSGYSRGQRELCWHFTNLEPTREDDIRIYLRPIYGPHNVGTAAASSGEVQPTQTGYSLPAALFSDEDPSTAWRSSAERSGAWIAWGYEGYPHYATPTLGLAILPGVTGDGFRAHGRPKEVVVRLARLREGELPPVVVPSEESFLRPVPELEITEHRLVMEDAFRWQFLRLEKPATVLAFQIVVESVYSGETYDDVAIAEILFPLLEEDLDLAPVSLPVTGEGSQVTLVPWVAAVTILLAMLTTFWLRKRRAQKDREHVGH